jgi:hypothetical protein
MLGRLLALMLLVAALAFPVGARAAGPQWSQLSAQQRTALAPLQREWPRFDADRKRKWLDIAARYPAMSAAQRQMLQRRISDWVRMTPQQRRIARANYLATGRASLGKRQRAWQRYQQLPPAQRHALARQAHQPPQAPHRVGQFVLHRPPSPAHPAGSAPRAAVSAPRPATNPTPAPPPDRAASAAHAAASAPLAAASVAQRAAASPAAVAPAAVAPAAVAPAAQHAASAAAR